jgi:FSR family fosmidomycin resistance protein-like MFS transporter
MKTNLQPLYWGLLHGVNDLAAGFLLAAYTLTHNYQQSFLLVSIYAVIGFGGQLPVGFWLDKAKNINLAAKCSLLLLPLCAAIYFISPEAAIIVSGFASAFVHVTGGVVCLQVHENKSGPLGLFTAPGVLGLTAGGLMGNTGILIPILVMGAAILLGFIISRNPLPQYRSVVEKKSELDSHDLVMLSILLLMCFRSFLFDVVNYVAENYENGILYIGISAFAGKIIGGFVADRVGTKKFIYTSLLAALLLFQFGKNDLYALCGGIACLQSSVPLTLLLMGRSLPLHPATASAFSLGVSIVLAGLPLYLLGDKQPLYHAFANPLITGLAFILFLLGWWAAGKFLLKKVL